MLGALYVAQGLPYGFFTLALPVLLRDAGVSLAAIGLLGLLTLPWTLKFLWAPVLDRHGRRRTWLLGLQGAAIVMALLLLLLDPRSQLATLFVAAFAFNLVAASQDVVTDGIAVRLLDGRLRGAANGLQVGAYRLGMILGGGGLLWLYARDGWQATGLAMAALLALTVLPVLHWREPARPASVAPPDTAHVLLGWWQRLRSPGLLGFLGLVAGYRFGDQLLSALLGPFLRDQGLSLAAIALLKGTVGSATSLAGAFLGGWFVFRTGRRTAILVAGLAQAATFCLYIAAAMGQGGVPLLWVATVLEGVVGTVATVALFTLMMDAADPDHAGTDYTLMASTVVLVGTVAGIVGGAVADAVGYTATFVAGTVFAVAGCLAVVVVLDGRPGPGRIDAVWVRLAEGPGRR